MKMYNFIILLIGASIHFKCFSQTILGGHIADESAVMQLNSNNKGFIPPKVTLTGPEDATTIPSPATGLLVYHTGAANMVAGLYINNGTPTSPKWIAGEDDTFNDFQGTKTYKLKYVGRGQGNDRVLKVPELNLEFKYIVTPANQQQILVRLINNPNKDVALYFSNLIGPRSGSWTWSQENLNFTSANFATYQIVEARTDNNTITSFFTTNEIDNGLGNIYCTSTFNLELNQILEKYLLAVEIF